MMVVMGNMMLYILYDKFDGKHYFYFYFRKIFRFLMGRDVKGQFLKNRKVLHRALQLTQRHCVCENELNY